MTLLCLTLFSDYLTHLFAFMTHPFKLYVLSHVIGQAPQPIKDKHMAQISEDGEDLESMS